jgi:hypothetical protein
LESIPDFHVMLETLALKQDYTGDRVQEGMSVAAASEMESKFQPAIQACEEGLKASLPEAKIESAEGDSDFMNVYGSIFVEHAHDNEALKKQLEHLPGREDLGDDSYMFERDEGLVELHFSDRASTVLIEGFVTLFPETTVEEAKEKGMNLGEVLKDFKQHVKAGK